MVAERYPNLKEEVDNLIPGYEISSLLDMKLVMWSIASCSGVGLLAFRLKTKKKKKKHEIKLKNMRR